MLNERLKDDGIDYSPRRRRDTFVVVQGVEVEIGDFVSIFNGEECIPVLSKTEILTEILRKHPLMDGLPDEILLNRRGDEVNKTLLSKRKLSILKKIIQKNKLEDRFKKIEMDRVLAMLSPENMRFDDVVEFVARFAEPKLSEVEVVMASVEEIREMPVSKAQCHYLTEHNVQAITEMDSVSLGKIMEYLNLKISPENLSIIMLERVLAGYMLSKDEKKKLSLLSNVGSSTPNKIINGVKDSIMYVGLCTLCLATPAFGIVSTDEQMINLIYLAGGITGVGLLARLLPFGNNSVKSKIKSSIRKYEEVEKTLQKSLNDLTNSPSGRVRLEILWEIVQHYLLDEQSLSKEKIYEFEESFQVFQTKAALILNIKVLYDFSIFLDSSIDNELSFNEMMAGRELNTRDQVLDAIIDYKQTVSEMTEISTNELHDIKEQVEAVYESEA